MKYKAGIQARIIPILLVWMICFPMYRASAVSSHPISIVDAAGRTILLKNPPRRMVVAGFQDIREKTCPPHMKNTSR
ncbi:MAG: hypothetical protein PHP23_09740 [Desulfobacterales bacterium]|nr:hypothetical protein [Desulfobacterales bacterium]MDD4072869.1 hypothetical protein [Desulfobacterales bacterium]MDD4392831.1 hypothetical protein [Desulfobacterales bacterium]